MDRIYSDLAVIEVTPEGLLVTDLLAGLTPEALQAKTGATLRFAQNCRVLRAT